MPAPSVSVTSLAGLSATAKSGSFDAIVVGVTFPASTRNFGEVTIVRKEGPVAPANCQDGVTVKSYKPGEFVSGPFTDGGLKAGNSYSYLACIRDGRGTVHEDKTVLNVTLARCGGAVVGPYCWYAASNNGQSCSTVCSGRGGTTDGTLNYTGHPNGTLAHCQAVLDALNLGSGTARDYVGRNFAQGCALAEGERRRYVEFPTDQDDSGPYTRRVCSCAR
jgi:hypothetical protein